MNFVALSKYFGKPEDVANDFLSELGVSAISQTNKIRQSMQYVTAAVLIAMVVLIAAVTIYTDYKQQQALDGFYIEEITYEGDVSPYVSDSVYFSETFDE